MERPASKLFFCIGIAVSLFEIAIAQGDSDLVKNLPGLIFNTNFKAYSGYLWADVDQTLKMHYWLVESQSNAATDPLLLWLNGGPGCSSLAGHFEELGPFYVNSDGQTLYENVYGWNQKANVLFLESPIGVGFSYNTTDPSQVKADDDSVAEQNYRALTDFFTRVQTKFSNRTFFISGESYAGIYLPTLAQRIIDGTNKSEFPNANFQGMAIGNGFMNVEKLMNSIVLWMNYHGRVAMDTWDIIKNECCTSENVSDIDKCNFYKHMTSKNQIDFDSDNSKCGNLTVPLVTLDTFMDQYNYYQDCYNGSAINFYSRERRALMNYAMATPNLARYHNTADLLNRDSTDNQFGYPCWQDDAISKYLNQDNVMDALNIDPDWRKLKIPWEVCNEPIYGNYTVKYTDTTQLFSYIIANATNTDCKGFNSYLVVFSNRTIWKKALTRLQTKNFRILIYNGDVDTVCNFLGTAWHMHHVTDVNNFLPTERVSWLFRKQVAGYVQRWRNGRDVTIDVLTVKGAGHFVPNDRPGPSVQMITNFMWSTSGNYSANDFANPTPQPQPLLDASSTTTVLPTTTTATGSSSHLSLASSAAMIAAITVIVQYLID